MKKGMKYHMPDFNNINDLSAYVQEKIDNSLSKEVYQTVAENEKESIEDTVFTFTPETYQRRDEYGLDDSQNMTDNVKDGVLSVENTAFFNNDYDSTSFGFGLPSLIENGNGDNGNYYDYPYGKNARIFLKPRPFIEHTREKLRESDDLSNALKNGLNRQGIQTK